MRVLNGYLVVKKDELITEEKTESGLFIPIEAQEKQKNKHMYTGEVMYVGIDVVNLNVGDKVVFNITNTQEFTYEKSDYYFIKEEHILAVF